MCCVDEGRRKKLFKDRKFVVRTCACTNATGKAWMLLPKRCRLAGSGVGSFWFKRIAGQGDGGIWIVSFKQWAEQRTWWRLQKADKRQCRRSGLLLLKSWPTEEAGKGVTAWYSMITYDSSAHREIDVKESSSRICYRMRWNMSSHCGGSQGAGRDGWSGWMCACSLWGLLISQGIN